MIRGDHFISIFGLIAILATQIATAAQPVFYPLDVHLHYWADIDESYSLSNEDYYNVDRFLHQTQIHLAFLISPTYHMNKKLDPRTLGSLAGRLNSEDRIWEYDNNTSQQVEAHPDRLVGICGANYDWEASDLFERVQKCLALPGMKGLKLHASASTNSSGVSDHVVYEKISRLLDKVENPERFVLWHIKVQLSNDPAKQPCTSAELPKVFALAKAHSKLKFIFAHSFFCPNLLHEFVQLEAKNRLENVYVDTSSTYIKSSNPWSEFGWDRVLFGSDNFPFLEIKNLRDETRLNDEQFDSVMFRTPLRFLRSIGFK